jgi:hypothetical protein
MSNTVNNMPNLLPKVPNTACTDASLRAEAATMGDRFSEVTCHPADLIADAEEMLGAQEDLTELIRRGYAVNEHHIKRIRLLKDFIVPSLAEQTRIEELSQAKTQEAEQARQELLDIRGQIGAIGKAAGLEPGLFSVGRKSTRLNVVMLKMDEVLENVRVLRTRLPDAERVDKLVTRARELIDTQKETRMQARFMRRERSADVRERERYERMLYDVMMYVSAQGLAAYSNDPAREARYSLDHIYGRKPSRVKDPGAGGAEGVANAGPSNDVE